MLLVGIAHLVGTRRSASMSVRNGLPAVPPSLNAPHEAMSQHGALDMLPHPAGEWTTVMSALQAPDQSARVGQYSGYGTAQDRRAGFMVIPMSTVEESRFGASGGIAITQSGGRGTAQDRSALSPTEGSTRRISHPDVFGQHSPPTAALQWTPAVDSSHVNAGRTVQNPALFGIVNQAYEMTGPAATANVTSDESAYDTVENSSHSEGRAPGGTPVPGDGPGTIDEDPTKATGSLAGRANTARTGVPVQVAGHGIAQDRDPSSLDMIDQQEGIDAVPPSGPPPDLRHDAGHEYEDVAEYEMLLPGEQPSVVPALGTDLRLAASIVTLEAGASESDTLPPIPPPAQNSASLDPKVHGWLDEGRRGADGCMNMLAIAPAEIAALAAQNFATHEPDPGAHDWADRARGIGRLADVADLNRIPSNFSETVDTELNELDVQRQRSGSYSNAQEEADVDRIPSNLVWGFSLPSVATHMAVTANVAETVDTELNELDFQRQRSGSYSEAQEEADEADEAAVNCIAQVDSHA